MITSYATYKLAGVTLDEVITKAAAKNTIALHPITANLLIP